MKLVFDTEAEALCAVCDLHNVAGCATCNQVRGECDYGGCQRAALVTVEILNEIGRTVELRPACVKHRDYMVCGHPKGFRAFWRGGVTSEPYAKRVYESMTGRVMWP